MGLDVVEMVMDVEDEFSIQIPHSRWSEMRTVGDMCRVVASSLDENGRPDCRSIPAFCALRRGFIGLGYARREIRPERRLDDFFSGFSRPLAWSQLNQHSGCRLPELHRPRWLVLVIVFLPILGLCWCIGGALLHADGYLLAALMILAGLPIYAGLAAYLTKPLAIMPPSGCITVGDLVRQTLRHNDFAVRTEQPRAPAEEFFPKIRRIVSKTLNIPEAEITLESRFIEDLKAG